VFSRKRRRFPDLLRSTVALHLTTKRTVAGILIAEYDDVLCLTNARAEADDGSFQPLDGEVVIPLSRIEFAQAGVTIDDADVLGEVRTLPQRDLRGTSQARAG
jgi:hypothetical protein